MTSKSKKTLTLEEKFDLITKIDDGKKSKTELAALFGIAKSTLSTILKNRQNVEAAYSMNQFEPKRKRMRTAKNEDVEVALMRWITEARI